MLFRRVGDAIIYAVQHRKWLRCVLSRTDFNQKIVDIEVLKIKQKGITVLALDFDGVLAPHGVDEPLIEVALWIAEAHKHFKKNALFILTNRPSAQRIAYFKQHFPEIILIANVRKKPYPDGMLKIQALTGCQAHQLMVVDDRLLTGALAARLAGSEVYYIANPYIDLANEPIKELFFQFLRRLERLLIGGLRYLK